MIPGGALAAFARGVRARAGARAGARPGEDGSLAARGRTGVAPTAGAAPPHGPGAYVHVAAEPPAPPGREPCGEGQATGRIYNSGDYLASNPDWHAAHSDWKAEKIAGILRRNGLAPRSVVDLGCGVGRVLEGLVRRLPGARGLGLDVSAHAVAAATAQTSESRVEFRLGEAAGCAERFDLAMAIDVFEHVEDCLGFLRAMRPLATTHVFHIPLDMTVQTVARGAPILAARRELGHLHYFSRATALATLEDAGYRVLDQEFTFAAVERPAGLQKRPGMKRLARLPRRIASAVDPAFAAHWLGGGSLLVLAR